MSHFTLRKKEILRSGVLLESLFLPKSSLRIDRFISRHTVYAGPLKCVFMFRRSALGDEPLQALFAVPKRNFKRAVKRNLIRRRMKEAYRLAKNPLAQSAEAAGISVAAHICYYSREISCYGDIENGIHEIISEITDKLACCAD